MKYRVTIEVGYCEAHFDFKERNEAAEFMLTVLEHQVTCDSKNHSVNIQIIGWEE